MAWAAVAEPGHRGPGRFAGCRQENAGNTPEGLYLLDRSDGWDLAGLLDACWYLDVGAAQALERVTRRHMASWGLGRHQADARVLANDRLNAQIVAASSHRAGWHLPAACAGL
jgi:pantothenate kinase